MDPIIIQTLVNSLMLSSFYIGAAVGLTLVYGVMRILNFTHGELYMLGAYVVWLFYTQYKLPFVGTMFLAAIIVAAIAGAIYWGVFRFLQGRLVEGFLAAIGLSFALQVLVGQTLGGLFYPKTIVNPFPGVLHVLNASVALNRIAVIPFALAALGLLAYFLQLTRMGRAVRACAQDGEAASLQGVSVNKVNFIAFSLAAAIAGATGAIMSPIVAVNPYMGLQFIWKSIIIVIVGGMGNLKGTILAALLFGVMDGILLTFLNATIVDLVGVLVLFAVVTIRPEGILGTAKQ